MDTIFEYEDVERHTYNYDNTIGAPVRLVLLLLRWTGKIGIVDLGRIGAKNVKYVWLEESV